MRAIVIAALLLAGCGDRAGQTQADTPGARLESAAREAGLVPGGETASLVGSWGRDTDRLCVVPGSGGDYRVGAVVDYGEGQSCAAAGTAARSGGRLDIRFGACRFAARIDGDRIVFPAELPVECERVCAGRASLAAVTVDRISASAAEASTLRLGTGKPLCGA
ncbi:hypothetical protein ACT009_04610 [Sphingomonas sp. Tas61C01]|uniref:hypothetical protein n=1 Tax=Sphingomonas sp. Tas61C01 TaxID=3458297 RepID=UPI00403E3A17